ncbi:unnamed protein product [Fusarium equiseti]|uniref:DUF676 domain-containing protein n=1 Tax=Fusarium equiseti TaxID=61235 RepID=A0A8J2IM65_FUSEQ|nr:unnamed protein product [Fusarium equiseti]
MEVIHDDADAIADICLIHGAAGDLKSACTESTPWLKSLLPSHLDKVRILSYGYGPYDGPGDRQFDVFDCTNDLRRGLVYHRQNEPLRPLIFVAHCVGGLVLKEVVNYCYYSRPTSHDAAIYSVLKGIIFIGTPHKAPWTPVMDTRIARLYAGSADIVVADTSIDLYTDAKQDHATATHIESVGDISDNDHASKVETVSLLTYRPELATTTPSVPELLATIDTIDEYEAIPIIADHIQMIKLGASDEGSRKIAETLDEWTSQIKLSQRTPTSVDTSTMASFQTGRSTQSIGLQRQRRHERSTTTLVEGDPPPESPTQVSDEMLGPSLFAEPAKPPARFYLPRPCYIFCFLMFLIVAPKHRVIIEAAQDERGY